MKTLRLNEQAQIPVLGFGTWTLTGQRCLTAVEHALQVGYRHIDTAEIYGNQKEIGQVLKASGLKRNEVFLVSKVWYSHLKKYDVLESCKLSLDELKTEYLDLMLIHWPNRGIPVAQTLEAMQALKEDGMIRAMGVSNFTVGHLKEALATGFEIAVNQVEFHPSLNQRQLKTFCDEHGIVITAYSPIARGEDLRLPEIIAIAETCGRSEAQVILNWIIERGMVAIPRSGNPRHIEDNFRCLEWKLSQEDLRRMDELNTDNRTVAPRFAEFDR